MKKIFILLIFLVSVYSCSMQKLAVRATTGVLENTLVALNEENDLELAEISIASNLKLLEGFLKSDPQNKKLLIFATFGYTSYAVGFVEPKSKDRAKNFYLRAKNFGLQVLEKNKDFKNANLSSNEEDLRKSLKKFSKKDLEILFWTANAWGSFVNLSRNDPFALAELWKPQALMERCLELDETFYFAGHHLFFGTIKGSLPKILGGKPEESKKHFDKALEITDGKMLMVRVYFAKFYAIQTQNREIFENQLKQVLEFEINQAPEIALMNTLAKERAKELLDDIDIYF